MKAAPANLGRVLSILALLASTGTAQTSPTATFQWPDSSRYSRVIVNAQEGMEGYPKEWFSQDTLVTDLTIADTRNKSPEAAMQQYQALRELLTSYGLAVGTPIERSLMLVILPLAVRFRPTSGSCGRKHPLRFALSTTLPSIRAQEKVSLGRAIART
jgi:hypothetical protein